MFTVALLATLTLAGLKTLSMANPIALQGGPYTNGTNIIAKSGAQQNSPNPNVPAGYQVGFATQDQEPVNQQSACTINGGVCHAPTPLYPSTAGPDQLPNGVYAAAIVGLGPDDCTVCGTCYSIISSGAPYCDPNSGGGCAVPSGNEVQGGPSRINVLITNHCPDCAMTNVDGQVQGHFDINNAPAGWDNPKIYYQQIDDAACTVDLV